VDSNPLEKIAKVIAGRSNFSRRDAEKIVTAGRVRVDGVKIDNPARRIDPDITIEIDQKALPLKSATRIWLLNKPKGVITTSRDPQGRTTVFDILPKNLPKLMTVGRLDFNTEGLLILTNDGGLARKLELPSSKITRTYKVRVFGLLTNKILAQISGGVVIDGFRYGKILIEHDNDFSDKVKNYWLTVSLTEGKNREIRRIFEHFNLQVNKLIRIAYGPFSINNLKPGELIEVPKVKVDKLLRAFK